MSEARRPAELSDLSDPDVRGRLITRATRELARTKMSYGTAYERQHVDGVARTALDVVFSEYQEHRCAPLMENVLAWVDEQIAAVGRRKDHAASLEWFNDAARHGERLATLRDVRRQLTGGAS